MKGGRHVAKGGIITGIRGFDVHFQGVVPESLQGMDDDTIKAWVQAQFSVAMPALPYVKAATTGLVTLGLDGQPLPGLHL